MIRVLPPRRARLGAGALLSVMLLLAGAAGALGVYYAERADAEARAVDREAGRVFSLWFQAAHRASQQHQGTFRNSCQPGSGGFEVTAQLLTVAGLRGLGVVPPGLPGTAGRDATFTVGIVDDGGGTACAARDPDDDGEDVPMAFGVLEPAAWTDTASLREGALEGGLSEIEDFVPLDPNAPSEMQRHVAAIETALGRTPATDALFVTADRGVRYRDNVVYRRAQPGQSRLNRMETDLDAGGCGDAKDEPCDVLRAAAVAAEYVNVTDGSVRGAGDVETDTRAASLEVDGICADSAGDPVLCPADGSGVVMCVDATGDPVLCTDPDSTGTRLEGEFTATEVTGASGLAVDEHLLVGSAVSDTVSTQDMEVKVIAGKAGSGHAQAQTVDATVLTAQDATVAAALRVTGTSTVGTLSGSSLIVTSGVGTATGTVVGLYGPRARIGSLTVGSCAGCYAE